MSNKLKRESKKATKKQEQVDEQAQKEAFEAAMKIKNAKYFPDSTVPLTGAEFQQIFRVVERTLQNVTQTVFDMQGSPIGVTMPDSVGPLNQVMATLMGIHKDNYENGIAVDHEEYVKGMEERSKVEAEQQQPQPTQELEEDVPDVEETVEDDSGRVIELSKK